MSQRLQTQQELLSDLEQERELMEELDARQRLELEEARRDADRAQVALVTATQKIEDLFEKLDHAHKFEQRYKQYVQYIIMNKIIRCKLFYFILLKLLILKVDSRSKR